MQLNLGVFDLNGRSGFVLKPECMRRKDRHLDPFEDTLVENVVANQLSIKVRYNPRIGNGSRGFDLSHLHFRHATRSIDRLRREWRICAPEALNQPVGCQK